MSTTHRVRHAVAAAFLLTLTACGGSDTSDSPDSNGAASGDSPSSAGAEGSVTLTVNGEDATYPARQCRIVTTSDTNLTIDADGVDFMLPPEPGAFDDSAHARVLLPESLSDEPITASTVHGEWTLDGKTATGTIEGSAHTVVSDTQLDFTLDFTCPYAE